MSAPVYVMPPMLTGPAPAGGSPEVADLLRQLLVVQQEQVNLLKAQHAASQESCGRWRTFLTRWADEFPGIGGACKQTLPALERAYLGMVREVTDRVTDEPDLLNNEFAANEFLDRYGTKLVQLGNIINQLTPLADAAPPPDKS